MRYSQIRSLDISNGVGVACSIFFQGCTLHCNNCFNQELWDYDKGLEFTEDVQDTFVNLCKSQYIDCISILGGEPLQQPKEELKLFLQKLKLVNKPIFLWSGYTYEEIKDTHGDIIDLVDFFIEGRYVHELKDYKLHLMGSSNQRILRKGVDY